MYPLLDGLVCLCVRFSIHCKWLQRVHISHFCSCFLFFFLATLRSCLLCLHFVFCNQMLPSTCITLTLSGVFVCSFFLTRKKSINKIALLTVCELRCKQMASHRVEHVINIFHVLATRLYAFSISDGYIDSATKNIFQFS